MKILIFGGTGSLGHELVERWQQHEVYVFSRCEHKQWGMKLKYPNVKYLVGDIINKELVNLHMRRIKPNIVVIAAAMKHIDICEYNAEASLNNNLLGIKNVIDSVEPFVTNCCLFVSSDKACSPVNSYGMAKALSERLMLERSYYLTGCRFVTVRYGNVLNSRGSIIPTLHKVGLDPTKKHFTLTHQDMTRFIMTLGEAAELIEYAIGQGETGDVVIPKLKSMYIKDLLQIFSMKYDKPVEVTGIRVGEKMYESLINETQSRMTVDRGKYYHIRSSHRYRLLNDSPYDYNSGGDIMSAAELRSSIEEYKLL